MLQKIIDASIKHKLIVGLLILAWIIYGFIELFKLPIDAVPDITNNQVQVITTSPSLGAPDVERLITFPIEQSCNNIPGLHEIRSFSRFGLSLVTIVFEDNIDIYWARQQVTERLVKAQENIPKGVGNPTLAPVTTGLGEIYQYALRPAKGFENEFDDVKLRTIQDWVVRRQLIGVKGVADVSSFGGKLKQYEVAIDPSKLTAQNLSVADVLDAIEKNNQNTGGAYIEKGARVYFIRTEGLVNSIMDIENICIQTSSTNPIYIKDVAEVKFGYANRYGAMAYNDQGEVAGGIVMMLKGENSRKVIEAVKSKIELIKTLLPKGVVIEPFLDRTKMVDNAIHTVGKNLLEGALIVVFVLVLVLGNFRAGFLVASVIPLAMLFAVIMMNLFGVSGNLMSLGALDFGLIVDGAVIIVEAVLHQMAKQKHKPEFTDTLVGSSAGKMMNSAVFGQIIILVVYLPIFSLEGIEGKMFKPMAQTVAFALLGAFILSLTYIPMMSALLFKNTTPNENNWTERTFGKIQNFYSRILKLSFKHTKSIIIGTLLLFVLSIVLGSTLGGEFIPTLEEGDFAVESRVLTGSNLSTTLATTQKAAGILKKKFPEVEKVVTKIGSGEIPTDPMPIEAADMMIILKDKSKWTSAESFEELSEKMKKELEAVPGLSTGFEYPVQMRFNELMTGAKQDVVCKIFGEDLDSLSKYAEKLGKVCQSINGATDLYVEATQGMPQIVVKYNRDQLAKYKGNIQEINRIINSTFAGEITGQVFEGEKRFDLVVRMDEKQKNSIESVENLLVPVSDGQRIPLHLIADIQSFDGVNQIQREDAKRRIIVGFNVKNTDVQTVVKSLQKAVKEKINFPSGYYITYGGSFENLENAKSRLAIAVPIALFLIFILLFFAFNSMKQGLLIYSAIPLSAMGGIIALVLRDMPFSISAGIGFIALFGVAVLNGIVLISEFNRLKSTGDYDLMSLILEGATSRLRPVMITALVASLGFMPMALSSGSGAEVQKPLATVVIGGLILATLLTLIILPILYYLFESKKSNLPKSGIITAAMLLISTQVDAQTLPLNQALDSAISNNLSLKIEKKLLEQTNLGAKQSILFGNTQVNYNTGQINSYYQDNQVLLQQSINWPGAQKRFTAQQKSLAESQSVQVQVTTKALLKAVTECYFLNAFYQEKKRLMLEVDSQLRLALSKVKNMKAVGESGLLDELPFELEHNQLLLNLQVLEQEWSFERTRFNQLTKIYGNYSFSNWATIISNPLTNSGIASDIGVQLAQKNVQYFANAVKYEKSKLLPTFNLGYLNTSFSGFQNIYGTDYFFNKTDRFHSYYFGVSIPILPTGQKIRIKQTQIAMDVAQIQLDKWAWEFSTEKSRVKLQLDQVNDLVSKQAPAMVEKIDIFKIQGKKLLSAGEIDAIDFTRLQEQSLNLSISLLDLQLNQQLLKIQYKNLYEN